MSRDEIGPEGVGTARGDVPAQLAGPVALAAELRAPRPEPPRGEVERVLVGEADGAVDLMRDAGADAGRLAGADLGHGHVERGIAGVRGRERALGGDARRRGVAGEHGQLMLDGLEASDGPPELPPLRRVAHRLLHQALERAGHLRRADERAMEHDRLDAGARGRGRGGEHGRVVERQRVARLESEVAVGAHA